MPNMILASATDVPLRSDHDRESDNEVTDQMIAIGCGASGIEGEVMIRAVPSKKRIRKRAVPAGSVANKKRQLKRGSWGIGRTSLKLLLPSSMSRSCKMCAKQLPINCKCGTTLIGKIVNAHVKECRPLASLLKAEIRSLWFCHREVFILSFSCLPRQG